MTTATTLRKYQDIIEGKLPPGLQAHIDAKSESKEEEVEESTEEEVEESRHFSLSQVNNAPILRKYQDILNEAPATAKKTNPALQAAAERAALKSNTKINKHRSRVKPAGVERFGQGDSFGKELGATKKRIEDDKALDRKINKLGLGKSWYDLSNLGMSDDEIRAEKMQTLNDYYLKIGDAQRKEDKSNAGELEATALRYQINTDDPDWKDQLAAKEAETFRATQTKYDEIGQRQAYDYNPEDKVVAHKLPGSNVMAGTNIDSYTGNKVNDNDDDLAYDYDLPKPKERRSAALRADAAEINAAGNTSSSPSTTTGPPHHQPFPGAPTKSVSRAEPKPVEKPVRTKPSLLSTDHDDIGTGWRKGPPVPVGPKRVPAQPASTQQSPPKVKIVPEPLEPPKPKPKLKQSKSKGRYDISTGSYSQT
jgi:hypothetical protein